MFDELEKVVEARIELLNDVKNKLDMQMNKKITGSLRISCSNNIRRYYHLSGEGDRQGKYIRKSEMNYVRALAQKSYNEHMISLVDKELAFLKTIRADYPEMVFSKYWETLSDERKELIIPVWEPDDVFVEKWLEQKYVRKDFSPFDETAFYTNSGIRVRSKTEIIIANTLDKYGLPFLIELPLYLNPFDIVYPDFTIMDMRTRTIIIWEHHGMIDDANYRENSFLKKTALYIENGFIPGVNLIQTFESRETPISVPMIETIIEQFFT